MLLAVGQQVLDKITGVPSAKDMKAFSEVANQINKIKATSNKIEDLIKLAQSSLETGKYDEVIKA